MSPTALAWVGLGVVVLVFLDVFFVEVRRSYREAKRLTTRLAGYGTLPLVSQAATAGQDAERLSAAIESIEPLLERARAAIDTIRSPFRDSGPAEPATALELLVEEELDRDLGRLIADLDAPRKSAPEVAGAAVPAVEETTPYTGTGLDPNDRL